MLIGSGLPLLDALFVSFVLAPKSVWTGELRITFLTVINGGAPAAAAVALAVASVAVEFGPITRAISATVAAQ